MMRLFGAYRVGHAADGSPLAAARAAVAGPAKTATAKG